jgi:gliding motility-associated-like protein
MLKFKYTFLSLILFLVANTFAQKGKNGAKTFSTSIKINEFTPLTNNATAGSKTITVAASSLNTNARFTSTLTPGDLIMIVQMQGALIKLQPYNSWEVYVTDSLYGLVYSYENCGNYEFAEVNSVISATQIELKCGLQYSYSSAGKTQIVRVPRYTSLNVSNTGTLTTDAWNGSIGGILAAEVDGNTTINGIVSANGLGFRGGATTASGGNNFYPFSVANASNNGSEKGEGVGSDRLNNSVDSLGKYCKGAPGNGGGGGNANNCGGGGGGNGGLINGYNGYGIPTSGYTAAWNLEWPGRANVVSSGGGKGGYGTSTTTTASPTSIGPNSTSWGSFKRLSAGGFGGRPLDYSTGKIFMGGGGGGGHSTGGQSNGTNACNGGAGGGLIYFLNYGSISGTGIISSNGADGNNAFGTTGIKGIDGAGGAGAGGTIILNCNGTISSIIANANGGKGGNQVITGLTSEAQGPGGGGSGGYIAGNGDVFTQNVNGGANGTTNASAFATAFPMNGATSGDAGTKNQIITPSFSLTASSNQTLCINQTTTVTATSNNPSATIEWYNSETGGLAVGTGTAYTTSTYTSAGTYTVFASSCPGIYRLPIVLTITNGPTISVNNTTICAGQTAILTASTSATSYSWNTGANTTSISITPTVSTTYTFSGSNGSCVNSQTATITVATTPTLSLSSSTVCSGTSTTLTINGSATNYTWMPGGQTSNSISLIPNATTIYTITGKTGACTNSITSTLNVTSTPTITGVSNTTICPSQTATFNASGATNYTWMPGSSNGSTFTIAPVSNTTVTVIGANDNCLSSSTVSVSIGANVSIAVNAVTICPTQTATLTASSLDTYTWSTNENSNSISVNPTSTTIYSVSGSLGSCTGSQTVEVTVISSPSISISGNSTICSGDFTTLTANSSANSYTWEPNGQTSNTISVNPTTTTVFTITGSNGACSTNTTISVNVTPTPTLTGITNTTICAGQTASFNASGATTYTWQPGSTSGSTFSIAPSSNTVISVIGANNTCTSQATASITIGANLAITVNSSTICAGETATLVASGVSTYTWNNNVNTSSINVNPSTTTIFTVTGSSGGCFGENTTTVTVNQLPVLTLTATPTAICEGESSTLTISGANTYAWSNSVNGNNQIVNPNSTITYSVTGTDSDGCENTSTITISVTPTPTISVNTASICAGQTATLTATGANTYTWSTNETTNPILTAPSNTILYTLTGATNGCIGTFTTYVFVTQSPTINISATNPTGCVPLCVAFTDQTSASCSTISYNYGDGVTGNSNNPNYCYNNAGNYTVTATCTSTTGCSTTYTLPTAIDVILSPTANFNITEGETVTVGTNVHLTNTSSNATLYAWSLCDGNTAFSNDIITTFADTGNCCITLLTTNGTCTNTITKCIDIVDLPNIIIPNVFTPNGDSKNDLFKINSSGIRNLNCTIFDRWGLKLYEWDGINGSWDGQTKTGKAPSGTYYYIINYTDRKDNSSTEKGFLTLFRE